MDSEDAKFFFKYFALLLPVSLLSMPRTMQKCQSISEAHIPFALSDPHFKLAFSDNTNSNADPVFRIGITVKLTFPTGGTDPPYLNFLVTLIMGKTLSL